jgi:four helix bundle protein
VRSSPFASGTAHALKRRVTPEKMKAWTFETARRAIVFVRALPRGGPELVLGRQLLKSATSVPAQYRAACRAQSRRDFVSKMKRMEEEADESALWLALLSATGIPGKLESECRNRENDFGEFTAIAVASVKTARQGAAR